MSDLLVMVDSGAYSAWSKGVEVKIEDYLDFCLENSWVDYFVNLDVMPPRRLDHSGLDRRSALFSSAEFSLRNYEQLSKLLGPSRLLPVFHMGTPIRFLRRYLDLGCQYICIGAVSGKDRTWRCKEFTAFLKYLPKDGNLRMHGLGITDVLGMESFSWYSVDSATWRLEAGYGKILVPQYKQGEFRYGEMPVRIFVTPKEQREGWYQEGTGGLSHVPVSYRDRVQEYLDEVGVGIGKYEIVDVPEGYEIQRGKELWYDEKRTKIVRTLEHGVSTCHFARMKVNAYYFTKMAEHFGVISYLGGRSENCNCDCFDEFDGTIRARLVSFAYLRSKWWTDKTLNALKEQKLKGEEHVGASEGPSTTDSGSGGVVANAEVGSAWGC